MSEQSILAAVNVGGTDLTGGTTSYPAWQQRIAPGPPQDCYPDGIATGVTPLYALSDGSVVVSSSSQCTPGMSCSQTLGTLYTLDPSGNVASQTADPGATLSWTGQWYDPPAGGNTISNLTGPITVNYDDSSAATHGGAPSPSGAYVHSLQKLYRSQIASIAQGYANAASTLWVPYNVTNYTGERSPSVKSFIKDSCNIFVGDVPDMAQRSVLHLLIGDTSYTPSPFDLSNPLPSAPVPTTADMSAPEFYHVSTLHPSQTGWAYIGSQDWATWSFYFNQPFPPPDQGPVSGQVRGGAGCWVPVPGGPASAQPGDVMAEYVFRGVYLHHSAINVVGGPSGQVASTSGVNQTYSDTVTQSNWGYRSPSLNPYGWEEDARARRWSCY